MSPVPLPIKFGRTATGPRNPVRFTSNAQNPLMPSTSRVEHEVSFLEAAHHLGFPVRPLARHERLDLAGVALVGDDVPVGIGRQGGEFDRHVVVGLDARVVMPLEQAAQRGLGGAHTRPQEVRRVGASGDCGVAGRACVGLGGADQLVAVAATAMVGIDDEYPNVRAFVGGDRCDDADVRVAANNCGLERSEKRAVELVDRRRVDDAAPAQFGDRGKIRAIQEGQVGHPPNVACNDARSTSCPRARSRLCAGRGRSVVDIAGNPVGQKAHGLFVGDDRPAPLELVARRQDLPIPAENRTHERGISSVLRRVGVVFGGFGAAAADEVTDIPERRRWHHRVEVDEAHRVVGAKQEVREGGIVVRDLPRRVRDELVGLLNERRVGEHGLDLRAHSLDAADRIGRDGFA